MRAVDARPGRPLAWVDVPDPAPPADGEVTLQVAATAVNRADLLQRDGLYPPPPGASPILGLEAAGTVIAIGRGVAGWSFGDRAAALLTGGGYAERVTCSASHLLPVPSDLDFTGAAALPEAIATVVQSLFVEAALRRGDRVLVHAGASGVGTMAIQLCAAAGCAVWVTAGTDEKLDRCRELGARGGANRHREDFAARAPEWTAGQGFDVVLDPVGAAYLPSNLRVLATGGRLVVIGLMGGRGAELDLGRLLVKRLRVIGTVLRSRSDAEKAELIARVRRDVWPLGEAGAVRPVVHAVLPIEDAEAAHALVRSDATFGKVVLATPAGQAEPA